MLAVAKTTMTLMTIALILGFALQPWTGTYQNVQQVYADYEGTTDLCGLASVECEGEVTELEQRIQKAIQDIPHDTVETENRIRYLYEYADGKDVNPDDVAKTIYCESMWSCTQSNIVKNGVREPSFCLSQIHAPSHPEMSMEQLQDPYFNIRYIVDNYYNDRWFGFNRESDSCSSGVPEYWK